jgi:glycosyltransferase involved in cell wall biosynthesis
MRRGVPVATSGVSSMPEVGGDAALYFDPERPEEIALAVERLLTDPDLAHRLASAGRQRCEHFSWRRTALTTLESYRRAIHDHRGG